MRRILAPPSRRDVLVGLGGFAGSVALPRRHATGAPSGAPLALRLVPSEVALRGAAPPSPVWSFVGAPPRLTQGETVDLTLTNDLPVPAILNWRSCDGAAAAEPLLGQRPLQPGRSASLRLALDQAGTVLCDARLLGDGQQRPLPALGLIVGERRAPVVDADHLVTIADWRIGADGTPVAPGKDAADASTVFTANGATALDIAVRRNSRLRIRFINACHRSAIAVKFEEHDLLVVAIDGQPAAPFTARGGQLMLAPGTRIDVLVDAIAAPGAGCKLWLHDGASVHPLGRLVYDNADPVRPAPLPPPGPLDRNGLPDLLPLGGAQRIDIAVDARPDTPGWSLPEGFAANSPPAFHAKRGGTVVLALVNRTATAVTFHLHGHHVRWLDRLDDGWKPFWLDTILVPGGQTVRVGFVAEHSGAWLLEAMGTEWAAPRLVGWYAVG